MSFKQLKEKPKEKSMVKKICAKIKAIWDSIVLKFWQK